MTQAPRNTDISQNTTEQITYHPYVVRWTRKDGTVVEKQYMKKYRKRQPRSRSPPRPYNYTYTPKPKTVLRKEIRDLSETQVAQVHAFVRSLQVAVC